MPVLRVIVLWHQHQPFYKDLVTGEYRLPWVRLHALKDYYGMVKLLDEFPNVHQTFNLVPSLITQIQDFVAGTAQEPFLQVVATPAKDLTLEERRFALQYLFQANPVNMIGRYPRYRELWERFRGAGDSPERAEKYFQAQDFTDLQVLSQIAWFDEFFLEEPDIAALVQKGHNYSTDDQTFRHPAGARTGGQGASRPRRRRQARRRSKSRPPPFYHPILPLVCDTNAGAVSSPGLPLPQSRFRHPEDAREQLQRGLDLHRASLRSTTEGSLAVGRQCLGGGSRHRAKPRRELDGHRRRRFGTQPGSGVFPRWQRSPCPGIGRKLYTIHRFENGQTEMHLIFRDHTISDLIGFVYSGMPAGRGRASSHQQH